MLGLGGTMLSWFGGGWRNTLVAAELLYEGSGDHLPIVWGSASKVGRSSGPTHKVD